LKARIERLLTLFDDQPATARAELRNLLAAQPTQFCAVGGPLLAPLPFDSPARQFLTALLTGFEDLPKILSDPAAMSLQSAIELATALARAYPMLDRTLSRWLLRGLGPDADPAAADPVRVVRLLEILEGTSQTDRSVSVLVQLLRHSDPRVRSKVTLLAARSLKSGTWAQRRMLEADPRVRANVVEALWGVDTPGSLELLRSALHDPHNRVVGNALVGLYLLKDPAAFTLLEQMSQHPSPAFRATAAWAMGFLEDPKFLPALAVLRNDPEPIVHRNVVRALARIRKATGQSLPPRASPPGATEVPSQEPPPPQAQPKCPALRKPRGQRSRLTGLNGVGIVSPQEPLL